MKLIQSRTHLLLYAVIVADFIFRIYYATSRPLFPSGPDAPTYMPAMVDFAKRGLLSAHITGMPYFPSGYPMLFSVIPKLAFDHWVLLAQFVQISLSTLSIYLLFRVVMIYFHDEQIALLSALCFALLPAYSVMSGEAMYETLMIFLLLVFFLLLGEPDMSTFSLLLAGVVAGIAVAVHPRVLPLVAIGVIYLVIKKRLVHAAFVMTSFAIFDLILLFRNLRIYKTFTLYGAGQVNYNIGHAKACTSITCDITQPFLHFSVFKESLRNAFYFLSPVSGSATRGTWYHNVSLLQWMSHHGFSETFMVALAMVTGVISIGTLLIGSVRLWKSHRVNVLIFSGVFLIALFTAFIMHGDSRQRLVVAPFAIPIQLVAIKPYLSRIKFFARAGTP